MKYFACPLKEFSLGFPANLTDRIIYAPEDAAGRETAETYITVPELLSLKDTASPHGIVLKPECGDKTVLLVPRIDLEIEIPEENIHKLPEAFSERLRIIRGISFTERNMILILDPIEICRSAGGLKI